MKNLSALSGEGKDVFNKWCCGNWLYAENKRKNKWAPTTKYTQKFIRNGVKKYMDIKPESIKYLESNTGRTSHDIDFGD